MFHFSEVFDCEFELHLFLLLYCQISATDSKGAPCGVGCCPIQRFTNLDKVHAAAVALAVDQLFSQTTL